MGRPKKIRPVVKCGNCDALVTVTPKTIQGSGQNWCSVKCRNKAGRPVVKCGGCDTLVSVTCRSSFWRGAYWCSQECKKSVAKPLASCTTCGKEHVRRNDARRKGGVFCSPECAYQHKKRDGQHRDCMTCGKPVWKRKSDLKRTKWFCSLDCSITFEHRRKFGTDNPTCVVCGKEHQRQNNGGRGYCKTCSVECAQKRVGGNAELSRERGKQLAEDHLQKMTAIYGPWWTVWKRLRGGRSFRKVTDWQRKWQATILGCRDRVSDMDRPRRSVRKRVRGSWVNAFAALLTKHRGKKARVEKMEANPWARKLETMSRNWRRKASLMEWQSNEGCGPTIAH
jgi:hypothetical protein